MRVGVTMAFNDHTAPDFIGAAAQLVEESGFHSVWVPEHVLFFPDYASTYPYSEDGRIPGEPVGVIDPFAALTWVASHTKTLRLGTGICLVPQRQPVYTAKAVADLDYLSGGRVDFGVGIGWLREEFDNLQMGFDDRAGRCVEYLDVMRALWSPGVSSFQSDGYTLTDCHFYPKPVQTPHPPIFFGGESEPALRRVAQHGDGWYGFNLDPEGLTEALARLDGHLERADRSRDDILVYVGPSSKPINPDTVAAYRDLGVDQLIVPLMAGNLERLARRRDRMVEAVGL